MAGTAAMTDFFSNHLSRHCKHLINSSTLKLHQIQDKLQQEHKSQYFITEGKVEGMLNEPSSFHIYIGKW